MRVLCSRQRWIDIIMMGVRSVKFSILTCEEIIGPITLSRGLRQGDPMLPYLFILASKDLTAMLQKEERKGVLHGCRVARTTPSISHLLFVDDAFLFFRATIEECVVVKEVLQVYHKASGQEVSLPKASVMFSSNVTNGVQVQLCSLLQVEE